MDSNILLENLVMITKLGQGQFGNVFLVKDSITSGLFALKCVRKSQIVSQNLEKYLKHEKAVCEMVNFPFIM